MNCQTEYTCRTLNLKNMVVRIHKPVLSEEERARRMKRIYQAASNLMQSKKEGSERNEDT